MSSPYQEGEIAATVDEVREELIQEFPRLVSVKGLPVRSPAFVNALPELLAASQLRHMTMLSRNVRELAEITKSLVTLTDRSAKTADRVYKATLLMLATVVGALLVSVIQLVK